ncbi:hypothetical protein CRENBAI_006553 [Crenichthys baileyi]|uniref:Uncharacterized protein n=1 Tax=Crenichthys baileyi TaxID=28760 RepID=A0AAV9RMR9_9TELE
MKIGWRLAWERLGLPPKELEEVSREKDVWGSLLSLQPTWPSLGGAEDNDRHWREDKQAGVRVSTEHSPQCVPVLPTGRTEEDLQRETNDKFLLCLSWMSHQAGIQQINVREEATKTSSPTMFRLALLQLLMAAGCVKCEQLTQPAFVPLQPGQQLAIDCQVSYSVGSSHARCIRQPLGKGLEWIGGARIGYDTY